MASQPSSRVPTTGSNTVRRNLFNSHFMRRPPHASASASSSAPQDQPQDSGGSSGDIVVRDRNGQCQVQIPHLPPAEEEQVHEEDDSQAEKARLEERLLEMYKNRGLGPGDPADVAELLSAAQASLRRKVDSLDEDNWMFESEKSNPG
ncbi:MAG: hypothetical protein Q9167_001736 [Letrouitia subvulpina]